MAKPTPVRGLDAATPMPQAARTFLGARLADLQRHLGKLGARLDSERVHDARVATRRLRAALVLFGGGKRVRKADRVVRDLQDALGDVRDLQVQIHAFGKMSDEASPLERTALRHLREHLGARLPEKANTLRAAIPVWERRGLEVLGRLERLEPRGKLGGHRLRERLIEDLEELEARVIDAQQDPAPTPMHELRKSTKRFRYALEILQPAMPEEVEQILASLVPLQESLGTLHDTDVRVELVDTHGDTSTQGTDAALQRLRAERQRQAQEVLRALDVWEEEAVALRAQVLLSASPLKRGGGPPDGGRG
ncbi:MAG TPA: CHAD domain-containing protein [Myxococcaceae bacterium]|nr:CHAD domain-containing protein [Myxococcaceae bacterium]